MTAPAPPSVLDSDPLMKILRYSGGGYVLYIVASASCLNSVGVVSSFFISFSREKLLLYV